MMKGPKDPPRKVQPADTELTPPRPSKYVDYHNSIRGSGGDDGDTFRGLHANLLDQLIEAGNTDDQAKRMLIDYINAYVELQGGKK